MLKEKVTYCEILDTRGIRRMSCRMKILPTKSNFSHDLVAQYDHKISSYITTQSVLITEQLSLS